MSDFVINDLPTLTGANLAAEDLVPLLDVSASEQKKITVVDLVGNATTLLADSTIPGAKILFGAGSISGSSIATGGVGATQLANDGVTAAKLGDESTVDLVTTLPGSGAFVGQFALDTDDLKLYCWDGSAWQSIKAAGSVNTITGDTSGIVNLIVTVSNDQITITTSLDNTASAAQFLAGPAGSAGAVTYRTITGDDLPTPTALSKGGIIVNSEGLRLNGSTIEIDNDLTASSTYHLVTYDAKGLITDGKIIDGADLPAATASVKGAVIPGTGLTVDAFGSLDHSNTITAGTYAKVTVDTEGHVTAGAGLADTDIPDHSAAKLTTGTLSNARLGGNSVTGDKLANSSTAQFGSTQPVAEYTGQLYFNSLSRDIYIWDGNVWQPIGISVGEIVLAGTYDAYTNLVSSVTSDGAAVGLAVGQALPAATDANNRYYVVVSEAGTGVAPAPTVALSPPDILLSNGSAWVEIDVSQTVSAQLASNIVFSPAGTVSASNVQSAIEELDTEKLAKAGGTMTGELLIGNTASLVFEGSTDNAFETTLAVTDPTADRTITFPDRTGTVITTGDTGTVTSTMIADGTIVDGDISATAEIAVSKLADGAARQLLQTDAAGTGVEWTDNVDIPGTLDVTGAATFDSTITAANNVTLNAQADLRFADSDSSNWVAFQAPATVASNVTWTLPSTDGTSGQVLSTNGTGTLSWAANINLDTAQTWTKGQRGEITVLTDGATVTPDFNDSNHFSLTIGGNRTLANPTNLTAGQSGCIWITQDGTGSRTLAFGSYWDFSGGTAPTLTTAANSTDCLVYAVQSSTRITATLITNLS